MNSLLELYRLSELSDISLQRLKRRADLRTPFHNLPRRFSTDFIPLRQLHILFELEGELVEVVDIGLDKIR